MIHAMPLPRLVGSALMGAPVTALLFLLMTLLIRGNDLAVEPAKPIRLADFVRLIEEIPPVTKPTPIRPPMPEPEPVTRVEPIRHQTGGDPINIGPGKFDFPTPGPISGRADGDAVPIVTSPPEYPARAIQRGIEGWVLVEFSIDRLGRVVDPRVVDAQPHGIFERAAMQAVERYRYKPRLVNGEAQVVSGVRQRIAFELQK
ncbi:MAG: TonB family protein [Pseudomonadales bacterium]|nr:TonB family protein [Pseudomonadales bacterium]